MRLMSKLTQLMDSKHYFMFPDNVFLIHTDENYLFRRAWISPERNYFTFALAVRIIIHKTFSITQIKTSNKSLDK